MPETKKFNIKLRKILTIFVFVMLFANMFIIINPLITHKASAGWYSSSWTYRKLITFNDGLIDGTLKNFPVLISITDTDLKNDAQPDGDDIFFVDYYNDNKLHHEIERYNSTTGELIVFVNMTKISSSYNKVYMYYGNATCVSQQNVTNTWDSNYVGVWHFNETTGTQYDSTAYDNDIDTFNVVKQGTASGIIGGTNEYDGAGDYITCPTSDSLNVTDAITMECWFNMDGEPSDSPYPRIISKGYDGAYEISPVYPPQYVDVGIKLGVNWRIYYLWTVLFSNNTWCHCTVTYTNDVTHALRGYLNGDLKETQTSYSGAIATSSYPLTIGNRPNDYIRGFDGEIDEVRISNIARNNSWIKTTYNCQNNPASFVTVGGEEMEGRSIFISDIDPANAEEDVELTPVVSATINSSIGVNMDVYWRSNSSGTWQTFGTNKTITNGSYQQEMLNVTSDDTTYWWSLNVTDGLIWSNTSYSFDTIDGDLYSSPSDYAELISWYQMLERSYPNYIEVFKMNDVFGTPKIADGGSGYDYYMVRITNESTGLLKPEALYQGSVNGQEWQGALCLYWFTNWLLRASRGTKAPTQYDRDWLNWILDNREIYIIPVANPWGFDNWTLGYPTAYMDYDGVNLIKNYDFRYPNYASGPESEYGSGEFSQNQSKALREFFANHTLRVFTDFHGGALTQRLYYAWACAHSDIVQTSPHWGTTYTFAPPDFHTFDTMGYILANYSGDYGGRMNGNLINPGGHGYAPGFGGMRDWAYAGDITSNPNEDEFVDGDYPGTGIIGFTSELHPTGKPTNDQLGTDSTHHMVATCRRQVLYLTDIAQPNIQLLDGTINDGARVQQGGSITVRWQVNGSFNVDNTSVIYGTNPNPTTTFTYNTTDNNTNYGNLIGGTGWNEPWNGETNGTVYEETITFNDLGTYYVCARARVDSAYGTPVNTSEYGNNPYARVIKERTNNDFQEIRTTIDGTEYVNGSEWWYSDILEIVVHPGFELTNENPSNNSINVDVATATWNVTIQNPRGTPFNWTIDTYPDIGNSSANLDTNGSKSCAISCGNGTTYKVMVNVTDETVRVNYTYFFTTNKTTEYKALMLHPNGNGHTTYGGWTPQGDTPNWKCVDEITPDNDATYNYVENPNPGRQECYELENTTANGTINNVIMHAVHRQTLGYPTYHQYGIYQDGTYYYSTTWRQWNSPGTTWKNTTETIGKVNPITGKNFTWDDINEIQLGGTMDGVYPGNEERLSATWLEVNYTPLPDIETLNPEGVEETNATFVGNLIEDGGADNVYCYFEYGLTTSYGTTSSYKSVSEGNNYKVNITGLEVGEVYHYRAVCTDGYGNYTYGDDISFGTKPLAPTDINATLSTDGSSVVLTWHKGYGSEKTIIRRRTDHYPENVTDGDLVYNGTASSYTDYPIAYGFSQYYRIWAWSNPYSDGNDSANITVAPAPPFNGSATYHAGTNTVNLTWERGNGSNQELVIEKQGSYPTSYTDGTEYQNNTNLYFNFTVNSSSGYFTIWSYNDTLGYYSYTGLNIPWGVIGVNCYNETTPSQAIGFNIEVSNYEGTQVYQRNGLTNTHYINVYDIPSGENTIFILSNSSYKQRVYYKDIELNQFINYTFYLPPLKVSGGDDAPIPPDETVDTSLYYLRVIETIETEYTEVDRAVEGAKVHIQRYINTSGIYLNVSTLLTDANGYVNVYLIPFSNYKIRITKSGYEAKISDYTPQPPNDYGQTEEKWFRITRSEDEEEYPTSTEHLFKNITWSIEPNRQRWNTSFTVWYNITSSDNQLQWYSMEVLFYNYSSHSWTQLFYQNNTDAGGGSINYTIPDINGKYSIECWFQKDGYKPYQLAQEGSLEYFIVEFKEWMGEIPDFAYYIVVLVIMIILMGFFYMYLNTGILTGYIGLSVMAMALLLKPVTIDGVSGWIILGISFIMYTIGIFLWSRI